MYNVPPNGMFEYYNQAGRVYQVYDTNYNNSKFELTDSYGHLVTCAEDVNVDIAFFVKKDQYSWIVIFLKNLFTNGHMSFTSSRPTLSHAYEFMTIAQ